VTEEEFVIADFAGSSMRQQSAINHQPSAI
jgi:hypothetical protein